SVPLTPPSPPRGGEGGVRGTAPEPAAVPQPVKRARPKTEQRPAPAPAPRRPRPRKGRWVAAAAVLLLLVLAGLGLSEATGVTNVRGTVIRLFSPEGTLVVEVEDPGVSVSIDGEEMVITGAGAKEIRLKPGLYKIQASKDGKLVRQELVTVSKNGREVVRISKEPAPGAAAARGEKPGAAPTPIPPPRPFDVKYIPADASAAVVVHPRRILRSPLAAGALPPGAAAELVKELGVRPEQVEQVIVLLLAGALPAERTPLPGAVVRFAGPVDGKQVLSRLLKGL